MRIFGDNFSLIDKEVVTRRIENKRLAIKTWR
jgi:hypothetical protein